MSADTTTAPEPTAPPTTDPSTPATPPAATTPPAAPPTPKKAPANPIKSAERMIGKAIKLVAEGQGTEAEKEYFTDSLRGIEVLLQTIGQASDPENPPSPDSAWGKTRLLAAGRAKVTSLITPGPRDAF